MENNLRISNVLSDNINLLTSMFSEDRTIKIRKFENQKHERVACCLLFVDGMTNSTFINQHIIQPIIENERIRGNEDDLLDILSEQVILCSDISFQTDLSVMIDSLLFGDVILFVEGHDRGIVIPVKGWQMRGISEPDGEKVMRGPREGFNENIIINLGLLRRKVCSQNLKYKFVKFGKQTNTNACMCYINGVADPKLVAELERRIDKIDIDAVLSANYVAELVQKTVFSPFKVTGSTERPDTVAGKILEGRIAVIIDGTPVALIVPHLFLENFQSLDDYYLNFYFATFGRILRFIGFLITTTLPAIYLSLITFHQELMPTKVLVNISQSRDGLPFPTTIEMVVLLIVFELIREGGTKIPSNIGQSLSIVGGLVLGQAAVSAKFVSVPIVIIVALTGITGLMIPYLSGPIMLIRFGLVGMASLSGLFGVFVGVAAVIFHLCSIRCFGIPYMSSMTATLGEALQDTFMRSNWKFMKYRPNRLSPKNKKRQNSSVGKLFSLLVIMLLMIPLSGCTGQREIDNLTIVSGVAVDKNQIDKEKSYSIAAEILNSGDADKSPASIRIKGTGYSVGAAVSACTLADNKETYWPHAKLTIIDKELAKSEGITPVLDMVVRNYSAKYAGNIVISDLDSAERVLDLETQSTNVKSFDISKNVQSSAKLGAAVIAQSNDAINSIKINGIDLVIPLISVKIVNGKHQAVLSGSAIFSDDKMVGTLDIDETMFLLLLRNQSENPSFSIRFDVGENGGFILDENGKQSVGIQIKNTHTRFKASDQSLGLGLDSQIKINGVISWSTLPLNMNMPEQKEAIEALMNSYITSNCNSLIHKAKDCNSDMFGFGARIKQRTPKLWLDKLEGWNKAGFVSLDTNILVESSITNSENIGGGI